jgi:hypothetical protein
MPPPVDEWANDRLGCRCSPRRASSQESGADGHRRLRSTGRPQTIAAVAEGCVDRHAGRGLKKIEEVGSWTVERAGRSSIANLRESFGGRIIFRGDTCERRPSCTRARSYFTGTRDE